MRRHFVASKFPGQHLILWKVQIRKGFLNEA